MNEKIISPCPLPPSPQKLAHKVLHKVLHKVWFPTEAELRCGEHIHKSFWSFRRMIYWADHPQGGIGVSFVDPIEAYSDHEQCRGLDCSAFMSERDNCDLLKNLFENEKVLNVASNSENELGRFLATSNITPFNEIGQHWREAFDSEGHRIDDVLLYWAVPFFSSKRQHLKFFDDNLIDDCIDHFCGFEDVMNTFTNCPFNYLYLNKVLYLNNELSDRDLLDGLKQYDYFTDGEIVNTLFGYYSPAYALALLKSLQKHEMLSVLRDFNTFRRYELIDPITSLCKRIVLERYKGVSFKKKIHKTKNAEV